LSYRATQTKPTSIPAGCPPPAPAHLVEHAHLLGTSCLFPDPQNKKKKKQRKKKKKKKIKKKKKKTKITQKKKKNKKTKKKI
jgi:hypothetical protein